MSFFDELKRRNVFRIGIAYVLMGWVLLQAADFAFDLIGAPNWVIQSISVVVVIGLPIALFFAWAFEMTPEGIKREAEVDRSQSITPKTGRKLDYTIIAILAVVIVSMAVERIYFSDDSGRGDTSAVVAVAKSIAVLPFADLSQAQDQAWFADGLAEMAQVGTQSIEAYQDYHLRGLQLKQEALSTAEGTEIFEQAYAHFEKARTVAPGFADAWAALADALWP